MFCYILTETRGKWKEFVGEAWGKGSPGSLWLFVEPTVWQLHIVLKLFTENVQPDGLPRYWWLDIGAEIEYDSDLDGNIITFPGSSTKH